MNPDGKTFNQTIIIKRRRLAVDHSMNMNSTNSTLVNDTSKTVEEVIV